MTSETTEPGIERRTLGYGVGVALAHVIVIAATLAYALATTSIDRSPLERAIASAAASAATMVIMVGAALAGSAVGTTIADGRAYVPNLVRTMLNGVVPFAVGLIGARLVIVAVVAWRGEALPAWVDPVPLWVGMMATTVPLFRAAPRAGALLALFSTAVGAALVLSQVLAALVGRAVAALVVADRSLLVPVVGVSLLVGLGLLVAGLAIAFALPPTWFVWTFRPLLMGDYATAVRRSAWSPPFDRVLSVELLALGDRADDAAATLPVPAEGGDGHGTGRQHRAWGAIALARGDLAAADAHFQRACRALSNGGGAPTVDAVMVRLMGGTVEEADLERLVAHERSLFLHLPYLALRYDPTSEIVATRAWLAAALGREAEGRGEIERAAARVRHEHRHVVGSVRWRLANACLALGDREGALDHARVGAVDPGLYGRWCRNLLEPSQP